MQLAPITSMTDLSVGDFIRDVGDRRYKITAVGKVTVLVERGDLEFPLKGYVLQESYKVERPEALPKGVTYCPRFEKPQSYTLSDSMDDEASISFTGDAPEGRAVINTNDQPVYFTSEVLSWILSRLTELNAYQGTCKK